MAVLKLFHLFFCFLLLITSTKKAKYGIAMFWIGIFLIPLHIEWMDLLHIPVVIWQISMISIGALFNTKINSALKMALYQNKQILLFFLLTNFLFILCSSTVPWGIQLDSIFRDFALIYIIVVTYQYSKLDISFVPFLTKCIIGALVINYAFSLYFELILGFNPTGMPLYILMGKDDISSVDMIETVRGDISLRLQSITGHPLSLGQYLIMIVPVLILYAKKQRMISITMLILTTIIVFLTGTRGAVVPLLIIGAFFFFVNKLAILIKQIVIAILLLVVIYQFIPIQYEKTLGNALETVSAYTMFWDDDLQSKKSVGGSTMEMRFNQLEAAEREISNNPLCGRGVGYREYYQKLHGYHPVLLGYESLLLLKLVEQGWLGVFFYLFMFWLLYKQFRPRIEWRSYLTLTFAALMLSEVMTGIRPWSFLILGMVSIIIDYYEKEKIYS